MAGRGRSCGPTSKRWRPMADGRRTSAASIRQRLLDLARAEGRVHEVVLVRYALERLLYRLSISPHRDRFALKGGMLVARWIGGSHRETRDADFLGFGERAPNDLKATFAEIMAKSVDDALAFDVGALQADQIREGMEYGGVRLRTMAYLDRTRIPVILDIGFGDAVAPRLEPMNYPSLLGMDEPCIQAYPPVAVIAEKFQAIVALGMINGRMKDYHDLWASRRRSTSVRPTSTLRSAQRSTAGRPQYHRPGRPAFRRPSSMMLPSSASGETTRSQSDSTLSRSPRS